MTDHDELRSLAENATPGPWYVHDPDGYGDVQAERDRGRPLMLSGVCENAGDDAEFIAAANPATILALLDELRTAKRDAWDECQAAIRESTQQQGAYWLGALTNPYEEDQ